MYRLIPYCLISIPSGTIKRYERNKFIQWRLQFQFLLVRLKEDSTLIFAFKISISIPSGTIKRLESGSATSIVTTFQFLLVRLKVSITAEGSTASAISIPSGTIKSE